MLLLSGFAPLACADVVTYSTSSQTVTLTGLGVNSSGQGQSRVSWGACNFDGANTTCTVSAVYTGLGGGAISMILAYPGNGQSPLTAISQTPGSNLVFFNLSAGSLVVRLTPNSGAPVTFYYPNFTFFFSTQTCTGSSACSVSQVGATPGATIAGPVNGQFDATPIIRTSQGVITASGYGAFPAITSSGWMEIYGTNLGTVPSQVWAAGDFRGTLAPTTLGGTKVTVGGLPAFIEYVTPDQINAQVPSGLPAGPQPVVVTTAGGASVAYTITVNQVQPGLLAVPAFRLAAGQYAVALFPDGVTYVLPIPVAGVPTRRAKPGDTIVFYGVGFGPVTPAIPAGQQVTQANNLTGSLQAFFGGTQATVSFAGLVAGNVGLYQFNVVVPNIAPNDAVPFTYSLNGTAVSQSLLVAVGN